MGRVGSCTAFATASLLAACAGEGSDIGPRLPRLPNESCKVLVFDDQVRGVVGAVVSVDGISRTAVTGRNGRGDLLAAPRGAVVVRVDGGAAAAVAGDTLGALAVAMDVPGPDLTMPVFLPDLPDAAAATLAAGTQGATTTITSVGGSIVTVPIGTSVGDAAAGATIDLRVGELAANHLTGALPLAGLGATLFGRGVLVAPADATFSPGIDLDVADDLLVGTGIAQLYHLDPDTGTWSAVANVAGAGGRLQALGQLTRGGLYAFGVATSGTTVSGRVVDVEDRPLPDVIVRIDQRGAVTGGDGRFSIGGVAARNGDASGRSATIELFAGGAWLPWVASTSAAMTLAAVDVGDLELDTLPAGNVRALQVLRARSDGLQPARLSSLLGSVALFTTSDASGEAFFEDVPADFFGFQEARRRDANEVYYGQSIGFLARGQRWLDLNQFLFERPWFQGTRSTRVFVGDSIGGGPVSDAEVVTGLVAGQGLIGTTRESGTLFVERGGNRLATASHRTERAGRSITHAISFSLSSSDHLEFPLRRVLRAPLAAFDRHGIVAGSLTGADPGRSHALRATRRITKQEWWDDVVEGLPLVSSLPLDVDPASTHGAFRVGLPPAGGHAAAIEYTESGGVRTLEKVGLLTDFAALEGEVVVRDVPLDLAATTAFDVPGSLAGLPPQVDLGSLTFALALDQDGARIVDVARDLRGNLSTSGQLSFLLPELQGDLAQWNWLALVEGETAASGGTFSHANVLTLPATGPAAFVFREFPTVSSPAPGATVAVAGGVAVQFALPAGAVFGTLELRDESSSELLLWNATVRPDEQQFTFLPLPPESDTPLLAGRTYTLTVSAWFGDVDIVSPDPYGEIIAFAQSIGPVEAGLTQVTRRSFQITTN